MSLMSSSQRAVTEWSLHPSFDGFAVVPRPVVLRLHLVVSDQGIDVLPGANARVLKPGDDPLLPSIARAKDVWVLGAAARVQVVRRRPLPQVDLIASVPTRAAEALFWAGRALERTELLARTLRVVLDRTGGVSEFDVVERWVPPALGMLASVAGVVDLSAVDLSAVDLSVVASTDSVTPDSVTTGSVTTGAPIGASLATVTATGALASASMALAQQLGSLLAEVSSVREFFSVTAGRVFARLADARRDISAVVNETMGNVSPRDVAVGGLAPSKAAKLESALLDSGLLDAVLIDIASVAGLWNESVVRGPAWRIGEIGRRLERSFGVIDAWRGAAAWSDLAALDHDAQRLIEIALEVNESLVAYRRRYRSDVEFATAARLVISDDMNPRSAAASIATVAHEAHLLGWKDGATRAAELFEMLRTTDLQALGATSRSLEELYRGCDALARDLVGAYLASPVDPRSMGASS